MAMTYAEVEAITRKMLKGRGVTEFQQSVDAMRQRVELRAFVNGKWIEDHIDEREIMMNCQSREAIINYLRSVLDRMAPMPKPIPLPGLLVAATSVQMPFPHEPHKPPAKPCPFCGRQRAQTPCEGCGSHYVA